MWKTTKTGASKVCMLIAIVAAVFSATPVSAEPITYVLNLYSKTYSFSTNGTIGPLTSSDITSFSDMDGCSPNFPYYCSRVSFTAGSVEATLTGLFFDPGSTPSSFTIDDGSLDSGRLTCPGGFVSYKVPTYRLVSDRSQIEEHFFGYTTYLPCPKPGSSTDLDFLEKEFAQGYRSIAVGPVQIGLVQSAAVPEPTTLALLAIGLAVLGFSRRKKAKSQRH